MNATEVLLTLIFIRLVLPFGVLLLFGEWMHRRERAQFYRR